MAGFQVMPKNTKVLNVSLTDNTCYVNLDSSFISGDIDVAEYIPIYAIVDSLTELQTVNKVQITVNGSADVTYRNVISLVQPLEREEKVYCEVTVRQNLYAIFGREQQWDFVDVL